MSEIQRSQEAALSLSTVETVLAVLKEEAQAVTITDAASYLSVGTIASKLTNLEKVVHTCLDPDILDLRDQLTEKMNERKAKLLPIESLNATLTEKMKAYNREEKRKADEERQRLEAAERLKQKQAAEDERIAREKAAAEERRVRVADIRRRQKAGEITKREAEKLLRQAGAAEEAEKEAAAAEAEEKANAPTPAIEVKPSLPSVSGRRFNSVWKWRMVNIDKVPRLLLYPNDITDPENFPRITVEVKRLKDKKEAEKAVPGIEVYEA